MSKDIEEQLKDYKINKYDEVSIPAEIDVYIEKGIQQNKKHEKTQLRKRIITMSACFVLILFLSSIRMSSVIASYVINIPGLDYIVKLVSHDKGLQMALENDFIQPIGISDTHEDITLTVDGIIVDEGRMVIFYTVENNGDHPFLQLRNVELKNDSGEALSVSLTYGGFVSNFNEERKKSERIEINLQQENELPDIATLLVNFSEARQTWEAYSLEQANIGKKNIDDRDRFTELESTWKIDIPINKEKFKNLKEIYSINKAITVHNQKIDIQQLVIHPTRMELDVVYDENNPLKIFSIDNLRITDEKGEWKGIVNGTTATHLNDNKKRHYFQSSYFSYPKKLYLEGDGIYALGKDQLEVVVDLKNEKLLKSPVDGIKLLAVVPQDEQYLLHFQVPQPKNKMIHDIFDWTFKDALGQEYDTNNWGYSTGGDGGDYDHVYYYIPKDVKMDDIITLKIVHYPILIDAPFKIRIK